MCQIYYYILKTLITYVVVLHLEQAPKTKP